jgi:hypothetical protein
MTWTRHHATAAAIVLASTVIGCGDEELFALDLANNERVIDTSANARLADPARVLEQPRVVGDLDGDGIADAVIRTQFLSDPSDRAAGPGTTLYVLYGGANITGNIDFASLPSLTFAGVSGDGVQPLGDIDGDGLADFAIGFITGDCNPGSNAYLMYGSATRLTGAQQLTDVSVAFHDPTPCLITTAVAGLGDLDGDGLADFAIGSVRDDGNTAPATVSSMLVFYGNHQRLAGVVNPTTAADAILTVPNQTGNPPIMMRAGDVDGDGFSDIIVGTLEEVTTREVVDFDLVRGSANRLTGQIALADMAHTALPTATCSTPMASFGGFLGDLDGDGADDFSLMDCVNVPGNDSDATIYRVFYGNKAGLPAQLTVGDAAASLATSVATDQFGPVKSQLIAGDIDGDGILDLVLSDSTLHAGNGGVSVIRGNRGRLSGIVSPLESLITYVGTPFRVPGCTSANSLGGSCIAPEAVGDSGVTLGDVTGDHMVDLLFAGADTEISLTPTPQYPGRVYLVTPTATKKP